MRWSVAADAALTADARERREPVETREIVSTAGLLDTMTEVIMELNSCALEFMSPADTISPAKAWKAIRFDAGLSTLVGPELVDGDAMVSLINGSSGELRLITCVLGQNLVVSGSANSSSI
jgi:hypothetical protein